ncbi:Methyltransferase type 11 [Syntrophobotulus glycolicus DSM 8271]|uniref:Methyltransferase type 11 n=1 Tax=Syntrophobotulus glycolicus (strain DSM 8271 / FlGlyR) TaxID=645991 RepID=F0STP8_SYNGF|nr:class I SAM-dependent methyltransferase [Syntrophobotulus glycolicus]ADY55338.1 Methyltransferase type 11 [Syntrophobotulus glycolicus DSM 8271]
MNTPKEYWNNEYRKQRIEKPVYDLWLAKYKDILGKAKDTHIIDLGCGQGNNSLYLTERGYKVLACDISEIAIERLKKQISGAETRVFDMLDGLPFETNRAEIVIADLCLHYFAWTETLGIVQEIKRILVDGGNLLLRVNSTHTN